MKNLVLFLALVLLAGVVIATVAPTNSVSAPTPTGTVEFDEFHAFVEINATDGDAGFQGMLDGGPWSKARVSDPNGRPLLSVRPTRNLRSQGMTEFAWESAEPEFAQFTLTEFLARFPAGTYTARGRSLDRERLCSETELTHNLPAGPNITSHTPGQMVTLTGNNITVTWDAVTDDFQGGPLGSNIVAYKVVAEFEGMVGATEVTKVVEIDVLPGTLQADLPADFFMAGEEYKIEVGAIEESGNATFSELTICTV